MFKISVRHIIFFALVIIVFTSFQGARYILNNRLQELGLLFTFILFIYSSTLAALNDRRQDLNWSKWVFFTIAFVGYFMVVPAYLWSKHTGAAMLPSVLAGRQLMILFLAPTLYFLYRIGITTKELERAFFTGLILVVISYIFFRYTVPIQEWWTSSNRHLRSLVVWDAWRGYRLVMPSAAMFLALIIAPVQIFKTKGALSKFIWLVTFFCAIHATILMQGRSMIAMIILGTLSYHIFFAYRYRLSLFVLIIPGFIFLFGLGIDVYFKQMEELYRQGEGVRFHSYTSAFEYIKKYPLLGVGMDSKVTISEQMFMYKLFDASDIGIVGIMFRFGLFGGAVYIFCVLFLCVRSVTTHWSMRESLGYSSPLLIALIIKTTSDFLNVLLSFTYLFIPGLLIASIVISFTAIYRQEIANRNLID